jgi:NAD(P)-dependent dehydrogenase (short-subunit alcohol dehydrogenase family)
MSGCEGRVAIVTGGGSGLGEAIAKRLAGSGVKVLVSDINLKGANEWLNRAWVLVVRQRHAAGYRARRGRRARPS